ncbi:MAG: FKBP-type peptidyl-prolyl cis-trans isomerase [Fimbriimonadaceae bacterium]
MKLLKSLLALCPLALLAGCGSADEAPKAGPAVEVKPKVKITEVKIGEGPAAAKNDILLVKYRGTFRDGKEFDSNYTGKPPYSVILGQPGVIEGWQDGLLGMKKGGIRKIEVPWQLAYGETGSSNIPPKTDLLFELKLIDIVKAGEENFVDTLKEKLGTGPAAADGDTVTIRFTGRLVDDTVIDKEYSTKPHTFKLGAGEALPFLEFIVTGMKVGGKRTSRIPPGASGYGPYPQFGGQIPAHSVLIYDVELLKLKKK